jgi:hypothetical protein
MLYYQDAEIPFLRSNYSRIFSRYEDVREKEKSIIQMRLVLILVTYYSNITPVIINNHASSAHSCPHCWGADLPHGLLIRRTSHNPPRGPSAAWWVLTTANAGPAD